METFVLLPRDGLTVKDARGFSVAGGLAARSLLWPHPPTLAGAVRTAIGREEGYAEMDARWRDLLDVAVLGPLPAFRSKKGADGWSLLFPAPLDAVRVSGEGRGRAHWLMPLPPRSDVCARGAWSGDDEQAAVEALWRGRTDERAKPLSMPRWWSTEQLDSWLANPRGNHPVESFCPVTVRTSTHLSIEPRPQTAREGALFSVDTVELQTRQGEVGVGCRTTRAVPSLEPWRLGGEARLARVEALPARLFAPHEEVLRAWTESRFLRLVLVTPASFRRGWRPEWLKPERKAENRVEFSGEWLGRRWVLRAAFIGRAEACSGWDFATRAPKPSRRLVPPGSVYYLECSAAVTRDDFSRLWLASLQDPDGGSESQEQRDGFGYAVPGRWPVDA